jgi:catechol 2,3-dioxygenase-like lactoylglutathione lyase family enzyme
MPTIARLSSLVLDTPDPAALAAFYSALTGLPITDRDEDWWELAAPPGGPGLAFQLAADHVPPTWPGGERPQQLHLDFDVDDLDTAERQVLELGARKAEHQPGTSFRVFLDPAGHPFCLCVG